MMSSLAAKYGRALLDVVAESGKEAETLRELSAFQEQLASHDELGEVLQNPALPFSAKRKIVETLAQRMSLSPPVQNFILVVLENARIGHFARLVRAYQEVWDQERGVLRGRVDSARDLESAFRDQLESSVRRLSGREVKLAYATDPSLIGGLRLQVGSTIFDGSIQAQLREIERRLASL